jgi:hypothetical protein
LELTGDGMTAANGICRRRGVIVRDILVKHRAYGGSGQVAGIMFLNARNSAGKRFSRRSKLVALAMMVWVYRTTLRELDET